MMYISDQPKDPHLAERGYVIELDQPGLGPVLLEGPGFHATRLAKPDTRPAPLFAEHSREICKEILGCSEADVDALVGRGVLFEAPETADAGP
jgi:crotonobetainyl-CoA:carnitine CoA-transferase CaiB-like acyl-CoA transferase